MAAAIPTTASSRPAVPQRTWALGLIAALAFIAAAGPTSDFLFISKAEASPAVDERDVFYRRYRGDDEVSDDNRGRGRGRGRGGDEDRGSAGGSGKGNAGSEGGSGGGQSGKGSGNGSRGNPNDTDDRFGK